VTDIATKMECHRHGQSSATFVCQHLARGSGLGFFTATEDPRDPRPDAWCSACEDMANAAGGWDEQTEAVAGITLLCERCYDEVRARNAPREEPGDASARL
jgi:hypothetical protein